MLCVAAIPHLRDADARAIDTVRRAHNPQAALAEPHVILAFGQPVAEGPALSQLRELAAALWPCDAVFRRAMPWWTGQGPAQVLLLPDEGLSTLGRWHDSLHRPGSLFATARRADLPFVPHIVLASTPGELAARSIADDWNARRMVVRAVFSTLALGQLEASGPAAPRFEELARVPLGSPE